MNTCKNCKHWAGGHDGYWSNVNGSCSVLQQQVNVKKKDALVIGLVEGAVDVKDRINTFEFITQENFGCVHFNKK